MDQNELVSSRRSDCVGSARYRVYEFNFESIFSMHFDDRSHLTTMQAVLR